MKLDIIPTWDQIEESILFVNEKASFQVNESLCHDQFCNFVKFLKSHKEEVKKFEDEVKINTKAEKQKLHKKLKLSNYIWVRYFSNLPDKSCSSELLKFVQFFYCIPSHNASIERLFSLMSAQWTKERNRLLVESVKSILCVKYNFKSFSCHEFHEYLLSNKDLLKMIGSTKKYSWYDPSFVCSSSSVPAIECSNDSDTDN